MMDKMVNRTILIVDDDESTLVSLSFIFKKQNLNVFTAKSGKEALPILKDNKIDLVLTDFMMPDIDGFELLKIIKGIDESILVIMVTAYGTIEKAI
jgi:DNA-binding NtrC family response regulator